MNDSNQAPDSKSSASKSPDSNLGSAANSESQNSNALISKIVKSSAKMASATMLSRVLGLVREQVMALTFGAGAMTDAFLVAYRIPNLMRDLFAEGAFSSAFVPKFVEAKTTSEEKARELLWSLFVLLFLITGVLSAAIYFFAPEIISLFAPSFKADPMKFEHSIVMTKMMAFYLSFVSIAALFMGALNSLKIFFIPSLAPALFNIIMILSMVLLPTVLLKEKIPTIYALAIGVFVGGIFQFLLQVPFLIKKGYGPIVPKKIITKESIGVFKLLGPGLVGFAATQINLIVNTILATATVVGAVSWLQYAFRLFQLPVGIASVSLGNSNLVHFSESWKKGESLEAVGILKTSYKLSLLILFPAAISLIVYSEEIVAFIFQRGAFSLSDSENTSLALRCYALGLPFYGIYKIFVPTFYSIDRQKIPVYCSLFSIVVNIVFCVSLVDEFGFYILAVGTSLSMLLNVVSQSVFLYKDLNLNLNFFLDKNLAKILMASAFSYLIGHFLSLQFAFGAMSLFSQFLCLALYAVALFGGYFVALLILREPTAMKFLKKRG